MGIAKHNNTFCRIHLLDMPWSCKNYRVCANEVWTDQGSLYPLLLGWLGDLGAFQKVLDVAIVLLLFAHFGLSFGLFLVALLLLLCGSSSVLLGLFGDLSVALLRLLCVCYLALVWLLFGFLWLLLPVSLFCLWL